MKYTVHYLVLLIMDGVFHLLIASKLRKYLDLCYYSIISFFQS